MHVHFAATPSPIDLNTDADDGRYRAGACNIGPEEIARRRRAGLTGVGIAALLAIGLLVIDAPAWTRLIIFPPLAVGFSSLEQVRRKFCVGFAMAGVRNFGTVGVTEQVTDAADLAADRRTALTMAAYCSGLAAVVTLAFVAIG